MGFVPTSPVKQYVPRCAVWRQLGCHCGGQCRQGSGSVQLMLPFSASSAVSSQQVLSSRWMPRGSLCSARGFRAPTVKSTFLAFLGGFNLGCYCGGQCSPVSGSLQILPGVLCYPGGGISVGADFGWIPRELSRGARRPLARVG